MSTADYQPLSGGIDPSFGNPIKPSAPGFVSAPPAVAPGFASGFAPGFAPGAAGPGYAPPGVPGQQPQPAAVAAAGINAPVFGAQALAPNPDAAWEAYCENAEV